MSKYSLDNIRVDLVHMDFATAVATSQKIRWDRGGGGDFSVLCQCGFTGTAGLDAAATSADQSATDAGNAIAFYVVEATAASAAGSAISGATLSLGPATVAVSRGGAISMLQVTSDLTTAVTVTINNIAYHTATTGPGRDGSAVATELADVINGGTTRSERLPHYQAIANDLGTGLITIRPMDDLGTGLTIVTTAAGAAIDCFPGYTQGKINVQGSKLSTNSPKYIGVVVGETTAACARTVSIVRYPTGGDAFPGAAVNCTT